MIHLGRASVKMKTSRVDSGKLSCLIFIIYLGSLIDHGTARSSTPPPAIRLYEVTPDGKEAKLLTGDPDSEISLELGKEYRLECTAAYPVQWVYIGNGVSGFIRLRHFQLAWTVY